MSYCGDFALGTTFDVKFTSRRFSTGAPYTLAGTPAVAAYADNSTTEITAGLTLTVDFDSRTGLNNVRVVATSGNGFAAGSNYSLVLTAGTVDSVSVVGEVIGSFSIEARSALRPTTAGRTLDVSSGGEAGIDWANVGSPTTTVGLSGTTVKTATDVETDTADIQARLPAALVSGRIDASVGAMAANVVTAAAVAADAVTEIQSGLGTAANQSTIITHLTDIKGATWSSSTDSLEAIRDRGDAAWTTATGFSTHSAADVWSVATRILTSGTNIVLAKGTGITGFNDLSAAQVNAELVDVVSVDTMIDGKTIEQSLEYIGASAACKISGAGTGTEIFKGFDGTTTRLTVTVDSSGNRTGVVFG